MTLTAGQDACNRCSKNIKAKGAEYCGRCLVDVVEKRVKRKLGALDAGKIRLSCGDKKSLQHSVAAYLIKKLAKPQLPVKGALKNQALVAAKCADEISEGFIRKLTAGPGNFGTRSKAAAINIFGPTTEKELELYAEIKRIKYMKGKSSNLKQKIQALQARYPGTIEALAISSRQIGEL